MVRAASIRAGWGLLAALLLAGCELIDQTTFAPSPEATAAKQEEPKADPRTPLVTIGNTAPASEYEDVLHYAVQQAEHRAPGLQYDLVAMLPPGVDAAAAQKRLADVMRDIMAQGVPAGRIRLGLRSAQKDAAQEVRVYVAKPG